VTLHIRVISPAGTTDALVTALISMPGVSKLVVLPGARQPSGDAVQFDVDPSAANAILRRLHDLGVHRHAPIAVQPVEADIAAERPGRRAGLIQRDLPPIWDVVEARIRADAVCPPSFYGLLLLAGLIAATGILINSQILIVGAMVVGPEYSAIMGVALGLDRRERPPVSQGLLALLAGFSAAIVASALFGLCIRALGETPHYYATGVRPVSDLINSPNLFSVFVAMLAGLVGVISLTGTRSGALIGVFISVTTIPAAADIGLSLAYGSWPEAGGSLAQLLLNVVVLIVVGTAGLRLQRAIWRGGGGRSRGFVPPDRPGATGLARATPGSRPLARPGPLFGRVYALGRGARALRPR
jgi:uncharacterized hydrophobic protein (TIGR00271 family)